MVNRAGEQMGKRPVGRPRKVVRPYTRIAATVDYRGPKDDELFFLFRGLTQSQTAEVFNYLVGHGNGIAQQATISTEHDIVRRHGFAYWRVSVQIDKPNYHFASLPEMKVLIAAMMQYRYNCRVDWMKIDKFLNS